MNLEDVRLSETNQAQKDKYCMISYICGAKKVKLTEVESRMLVAMGWQVGGGGNGEMLVKDHKVSVMLEE